MVRVHRKTAYMRREDLKLGSLVYSGSNLVLADQHPQR